jgi:hypothetical protein
MTNVQHPQSTRSQRPSKPPASLILHRGFHLRSVIYDDDGAPARAQEVTT